ncbi:TraB/GumN family protein [Ideonella sp. DXS29W]|uniref:TraB/GumN family protein n=1 Tax=Ideonella lacteola TaxID=2984193 RepID=A0ABU9C081_9BURK
MITTPAGHRGILIGTVHVGVQGLRQPSAAIFDGAKRHIVEQVPSEGPMPEPRPVWPPALAKLTKTQRLGEAPWAAQVSPQERAELRRRIACRTGYLDNQVDWELATSLAMESPLSAAETAIRPCAPPGIPSRDELLSRYARDRNVPTYSLEVNAEVEKRRRSVEDRIHLHQLHVGLSERQPEAMATITRTLNTGDFDEVTSVLSSLAANQEDAAIYERKMLADRNEAWVPRLLKYLEDGDAVISVGVAHLSGPNGLPALLRRAGMRVEPVVLPQALP